MNEYDYINENMGGWGEDGLPNFMSAPGFSDDGYGNVDYAFYRLEDYEGKLMFRNMIGMMSEQISTIPFMEGVNNKNISASRDFFEEAYDVSQSAYLDFADVWHIVLDADKNVFSIITIGKKGVTSNHVDIKPFEVEDEEEWESHFRYEATGLKEKFDMYRMPFLKRLTKTAASEMFREDVKENNNKYNKEG